MQRFAEHLVGDSDAVKTWRANPPTPHDLRRTIATRLAALGVSKEDRDAVMNHKPQGIGEKHYNLYERQREKRQALDKWSAELSRIIAGEPTDSNIVPLAKARPSRRQPA